LTEFFQDRVLQRPRLPEEHFLDVVHDAVGVDVLLVTGMRDEAPVAALSHLVPASRVLEVYVKTSEKIRKVRRQGIADNAASHPTVLNHSPSFFFENDQTGDERAKRFAEHYLLPYFSEDLQRLAQMVGRVPDFPCPGIEFRHILNIAQQPDGLALCASLLQSHFTGDWGNVDMMACCEAGGFVFASALASRVGVPLALIREAGKLPPPTLSVSSSASHISASVTASNSSKNKHIEVGRETIPRGASVVIVDDVLATGNTLSAVLQLLYKVGVSTDHIRIMVVAEFPIHRGRELLRERGFGRVDIQSLLVFDGA
jgi:adenine phosphoribosyltransferase